MIARKFLGFMLIEHEIELNLIKFLAILDMKRSTNFKENGLLEAK